MPDFEDIRPYNDQEAMEALRRVAKSPLMPLISRYLFRGMPSGSLSTFLQSFDNVKDFQEEVMVGIIDSILQQTSEGLTVGGTNYLKALNGKKFLVISNHRDITVDPMLIQYTQVQEGGCAGEICVGSNLLSNKTVEDFMRSNKMIRVNRGISARELYESSLKLSEYIRDAISGGRTSVWIAQREGRTKDGIDRTEQGILKMLDMSGKGSFEQNFEELSILPMSISYEYEPCDARKAREVLIKRSGEPYVKKKNEDMHSILTGIRQQKGGIHLEILKPLSVKDIARAGKASGNEKYQVLLQTIDSRISSGYYLWKTNYIAHDMLSGRTDFADKYSSSDYSKFDAYVRRKVLKVSRGLDKEELRKVFLGIYANPIDSKA